MEAVIFDWGGTLTPWHDIDFAAEARALAAAVARVDGAEHTEEQTAAHAERLGAAGNTVWGRSRDEQVSAMIADLFTEAGLDHDEEHLHHYRGFWEPHTFTDPQVEPLWRWLREQGIAVGVLSNTIWPREWHRDFFERDGVLHLIDGDVYSSEIAWTKPSPHAFRAAMDAVGAGDPARCVYVGDRLYDDVWGAQQAGLRAVHIPHSAIPDVQRGHTEGTPDAVAHELADLRDIVARWM
ncbi:HAD family hydrolase [Nocardioides sp. CBS4Y-1]|uniref:HAD family hydrolase n=1 Tax=Nocardioides acrostichi TaxID=2784339 RepID=A0A930UZM4_9ACTN|nr:HAD family hydrolase [Nocardioides acrostichi]